MRLTRKKEQNRTNIYIKVISGVISKHTFKKKQIFKIVNLIILTKYSNLELPDENYD